MEETAKILRNDHEARCPVCATLLSGEVIRCSRCDTPHHADCWAYFGRCAIFGCDDEGFRLPVAERPLRELALVVDAWYRWQRRRWLVASVQGLGLTGFLVSCTALIAGFNNPALCGGVVTPAFLFAGACGAVVLLCLAAWLLTRARIREAEYDVEEWLEAALPAMPGKSVRSVIERLPLPGRSGVALGLYTLCSGLAVIFTIAAAMGDAPSPAFWSAATRAPMLLMLGGAGIVAPFLLRRHCHARIAYVSALRNRLAATLGTTAEALDDAEARGGLIAD